MAPQLDPFTQHPASKCPAAILWTDFLADYFSFYARNQIPYSVLVVFQLSWLKMIKLSGLIPKHTHYTYLEVSCN